MGEPGSRPLARCPQVSLVRRTAGPGGPGTRLALQPDFHRSSEADAVPCPRSPVGRLSLREAGLCQPLTRTLAERDLHRGGTSRVGMAVGRHFHGEACPGAWRACSRGVSTVGGCPWGHVHGVGSSQLAPSRPQSPSSAPGSPRPLAQQCPLHSLPWTPWLSLPPCSWTLHSFYSSPGRKRSWGPQSPPPWPWGPL